MGESEYAISHTVMPNWIYDNHKTNEINSGSKLKRSPQANTINIVYCMCSLVVSLVYMCYFITWVRVPPGSSGSVSSFRQFVVVVVLVVSVSTSSMTFVSSHLDFAFCVIFLSILSFYAVVIFVAFIIIPFGFISLFLRVSCFSRNL